MAFESIADKKIRSLLTMLGIIIGVGAVLILVSVVQGYNADLTAYYEKQGVNKVNVTLLNFDRTNTTVSCIVTNARLTKAQATKVAQIAADAYAHVIRPVHTTNDGDTVYVMATGELDRLIPLDVMALAATRALEQALLAGCTEATALCGLPAARDLR